MKFFIRLFVFAYIFFSIFLSSYATEETLILFDGSVSMLEIFENEPKYIIAIKSAKEVLNSLPNSKKIGLRTIGMSINTLNLDMFHDDSVFCKATSLASPIASNNIYNINQKLDKILPLGATPLTYSLDKAVHEDFSSGSRLKHIILITDGGESCNQDPCLYIRNLMAKRKDIKIDIIAIGVHAEDFKQLKCLSDTTSGILVNAHRTDEITKAFKQFLLPTTNFNQTSSTNTYDASTKVNYDIKYNDYNIKYNANDDINYKTYEIEVFD